MKKILLGIAIILTVISCNQSKNMIYQNENYDITAYIQKLDSLGYDTSNATLFKTGFQHLYFGMNDKGNAIIEHLLIKSDTFSGKDYREWSVQNTKNGNYGIAIDKLEKAMQISPQNVSGYYGWVLLYYYRDYEKALITLEQHDAYTPNFSDAPVGEDIHYLKGLCHMQLENYQKAIDEFNIYIHNLAITQGEDFVDVYTFVQKGRCLTLLGNYKEAIQAYQKAIKYYEDCSEAYYFMGLTQIKMNDKVNACHNFNISLKMINKGYKSSDNYVEYFHEIYPQQIEQSINQYCN